MTVTTIRSDGCSLCLYLVSYLIAVDYPVQLVNRYITNIVWTGLSSGKNNLIHKEILNPNGKIGDTETIMVVGPQIYYGANVEPCVIL